MNENAIVRLIQKLLYATKKFGLVRTFHVREDATPRFVCAGTDDGTVPLCVAGMGHPRCRSMPRQSPKHGYRCIEKSDGLPSGYKWCPDCQNTYHIIHGFSGLNNHPEESYCKRSIIINIDI